MESIAVWRGLLYLLGATDKNMHVRCLLLLKSHHIKEGYMPNSIRYLPSLSTNMCLGVIGWS